MTAEKLLKIAAGEIGTKEAPAGSNKQKYGAAYGWNGVSWCVQFLWWCFREAGASKLFLNGGKTASCTVLYSYHRQAGQAVEGEYKPGDVIFFNFSGGRSTDHVGICESWDGRTITTIDGNTGSGNEANGGAVMRRRRDKSLIAGAYRPAYEKEVKEMDNTPSRWAAADVEWAREKGLLQGDDTGNLKLHEPVTREEMCVFLRRLENIREKEK